MLCWNFCSVFLLFCSVKQVWNLIPSSITVEKISSYTSIGWKENNENNDIDQNIPIVWCMQWFSCAFQFECKPFLTLWKYYISHCVGAGSAPTQIPETKVESWITCTRKCMVDPSICPQWSFQPLINWWFQPREVLLVCYKHIQQRDCAVQSGIPCFFFLCFWLTLGMRIYQSKINFAPKFQVSTGSKVSDELRFIKLQRISWW